MKKREFNFKNASTYSGPTCTKQEIIDSLQDFARQKKAETFTHKQYDAWNKRILCSSQIAFRFDGWAIAMEAAGLEPAWGKKKDVKEMVETYMDCWEEQGEIPTERVFLNYLKKVNSRYTANVYKRQFGGWRRLTKRIIDFHADKISEVQLLEKHQPDKKDRRPISLGTRNKVMARDENRCKLCGRSAENDKVILEVDHIIPVSKGGRNEIENLQTLCYDCNRGKSDRT